MAKKICTNIVRREPMDQISTLPDDVLVRILLFVPTEEAVVTSILSKRWKFLWTLIPVLDFDFIRFSEKFLTLDDDDIKRRFLDFVELLKLLLLKFAMRSNCLTLDLNFSYSNPMSIFENIDMYTLPVCFFPHRSVSKLKLTCCKFMPSLYRGFTSVNVVKLTFVELQKDSVYDLVSKCPRLEELHLVRCEISSSFFELNAPESNLKCLVLQSCHGNDSLGFEHACIHIPTLLQLKYEGVFTSGHLSISSSKNLIEAEVDISCSLTLHNEHQLTCKLLKGLQNVKSLALFSHNLKVLNMNGGIRLPTPFNNLKNLTVKLAKVDKELLGFVCLLRSSPYLETLSLSIDFSCLVSTFICLRMKFYPQSIIGDEETVQQLCLLPPECLAHLMKIKIEYFQGLKVEMEFVKLFLRSSLCLKEMVICMSSTYRFLKLIIGKERSKTLKKKKAKIIERLLAYKRASPDAQILLK
ncbi:hypothetical protein MKW92_031682 [Papaver armeniacum]|nr:hypothetical protein MKW92_031682 [Papaver armeniacum]